MEFSSMEEDLVNNNFFAIITQKNVCLFFFIRQTISLIHIALSSHCFGSDVPYKIEIQICMKLQNRWLTLMIKVKT